MQNINFSPHVAAAIFHTDSTATAIESSSGQQDENTFVHHGIGTA